VELAEVIDCDGAHVATFMVAAVAEEFARRYGGGRYRVRTVRDGTHN
jgi:hypothetical protein